jgi:hypothetical protein
VLTAEEILQSTNIDEIREENGSILEGQERIVLGEKVKAVLLEGKVMLLVERNDGALKDRARWVTLPKSRVRKY